MTVMSEQTRYAREKRAGSSVAQPSVRQNRDRAPFSFHNEEQPEVSSPSSFTPLPPTMCLLPFSRNACPVSLSCVQH